jgi:hypothetical protein
MTEGRRFPPPWSVDDPDTKLGCRGCCEAALQA